MYFSWTYLAQGHARVQAIHEVLGIDAQLWIEGAEPLGQILLHGLQILLAGLERPVRPCLQHGHCLGLFLGIFLGICLLLGFCFPFRLSLIILEFRFGFFFQQNFVGFSLIFGGIASLLRFEFIRRDFRAAKKR